MLWLTPSEPTKCLRDGTCGSFARSSFLGVVAASTCTKPFSSISHYNTSSPCPVSSKLRKTIVLSCPPMHNQNQIARGIETTEKKIIWTGQKWVDPSKKLLQIPKVRIIFTIQTLDKYLKSFFIAKDLSHVPCKFYKVGGCTAGSSCPFSHSTGEPGAQKEACTWFVKGNCKFGHKCALAHILPGQSMAMDRKNKKAAQSAVAASASTGAGPEKSARSGVRGPKREPGSGGNGASGRLPLLAGGSTAPTRIMSAGSSGSTSSGRPPMNMPLKATISPSAPAPPLKDTDFTSFAALDEMEGFHLPSSSSQQVYRPERTSEEPRTPDADLSKAGATDVPVTPTVPRLSMNNVTNDFGPIGSPPYRSPVGTHTSPSRANGNTFSPGTSPRAHSHINGVNTSSSPNNILPSQFSVPVSQDTFASPQYTTTGGIAASLGSGMMMSGRKWGDAVETAASVGASSFGGLFSSHLSSSVTNQRTINGPGVREYDINDEFVGSRHPRKLSRGAEIAVEDEDLEDFLPSSLNDLLTSEERSRRMSRSNSGQGSGAGHLTSALVAATNKESKTPPAGNGGIGHRYSRSVPAPTLLGDIKSIWADTGAQPMPTPPNFPTHRGTPSASYSSRFDSMGANNHGEDFGLSMSVGSTGTPSSFGMISPSNASAAFLPGLHHHYLNAKAKQAQAQQQAQQQAQLGQGGIGRTLRGSSNPLFTGANAGSVSNSSMTNNYLQPLRGLGLPSSVSSSSGFHTHTHGNTQTTYRTTPSPFDLTQGIHQPQPQTSRPIPSTHNNSHSGVDDPLLAPPVISPSSRALQAHTPGQSLPQGLAAGYSRIHALPPVTNTFSPPTSGSFIPGSTSGHEAPFNDWTNTNKAQPTITVQGPVEAGGLGSGLDSVFSRLSYPTPASRSGNNAPPPGLTRNINGGRYPQQPQALSPLSRPAGARDDDDLFDMDK